MFFSEEKLSQFLDEVFNCYEKYGSEEYGGEAVSQLEHMLQCAMLAEKEGYSEEIILAAFFHDIGHICKGEAIINTHDQKHESIGANYLIGKGFPTLIAELVDGHVKTKRYLTYKKRNYLNELSEASLVSLKIQGGPMKRLEAEKFEKEELFRYHLKIREWDDKAKIPGAKTHSLLYYKQMAKNLLKKKLLQVKL